MFSSAILLAIIFGSGYVLCREHGKLQREFWSTPSDQSRTQPPTRRIAYPTVPLQPQLRILEHGSFAERINSANAIRAQERWQHQNIIRGPNHPDLVITWARAMGNLIQSATKHVNEAQILSENGYAVRSVLSAVMGVEKMARALLHCYGLKPNLGYGQADELRLLQAVAKEDTQNECFQKAIDMVEKLIRAKTAIESLPHNEISVEFTDKVMAKHVCDEAEETVEFFRQIIDRRFGKEIYG